MLNLFLAILNWLRSFYVIKSDNYLVAPELSPVWLQTAWKEIGVKETESSNPRIEEYHKATHLNNNLINQDTPWCASFICWALEQVNIESPKSAWARSFLTWGEKLDIPRIGSIVVFKRGIDSGHVGFYIGEYPDSITVLSGNSNNCVRISDYPKSNVLGFRWPKA